VTNTDKPLKVLVVFWGTGGAGVRYSYRVLRELTLGLGADNVHASLSANNGWLDLVASLGARLHTVGSNEGHRDVVRTLAKLPAAAIRFMRLCRQVQPDVILVPMNFAHASVLGLAAAILRVRLVYVIHDAQPHPGDYAQFYQRLSQRILVRCATRLVAPSAFVAENALADAPDRAVDRIDVAPLNEIADRVRPEPPVLGEGPVRFLFLGRLLRYKGLHLLAEALRKMADRADWRLTIAGNGLERDYVLRAFAGMPQADLTHVRWLEEGDVDALLRNADVIICPYIEASQSGVVPEGQRFGLPAIVTPVGALVEQIDQGSAGWVTRSVTSAAIAETMIRVLDNRAEYQPRAEAALALSPASPGQSGWPAILHRAMAD
jgi:glycosyltransferase involved in cell wall biosynthesis